MWRRVEKGFVEALFGKFYNFFSKYLLINAIFRQSLHSHPLCYPPAKHQSILQLLDALILCLLTITNNISMVTGLEYSPLLARRSSTTPLFGEYTGYLLDYGVRNDIVIIWLHEPRQIFPYPIACRPRFGAQVSSTIYTVWIAILGWIFLEYMHAHYSANDEC